MDTPNYARYLQSVYQNTNWEVARIPHGSINATLHATKTAGQAGPQSLILKRASPFFEDEGQLQPFSLNRQEVEATVMSLWGEDGLFGKATASQNTWRLPRFIRYDRGAESDLLITDKSDEASILLLEDLGKVVNLFERIEIWAQSDTSPKVKNMVLRIGNILGSSLATMHSRETAVAIESRPDVADVLSQSLTADVVWYLAMDLLPEYLANVPKGEMYYQRLVEDIKNPQYTYPGCFVHGDFNFGNILLPLTPDLDHDLQPVIIDWEFATSNGRGVNGDVSEFLSILHCRLISARRQQPALGDLLRQLCNSFCSAYCQRAGLECKMEKGDLNSQIYRSALLLNGRDMINYAHDSCTEDKTFDEMIKIGLWYLERAGDNMNDFLGELNRAELLKEDECLINSLFIFN
ncbi:kinase-like domain-containing protein [Aspergillus pseudonomiae]|uniref:Kinase-like domain-containing protein n=1 Tax=Aspergillus pseudonomiae TaxID=1506151 RepID=A0A5N7CRV2_9EURO|nr:kinase-like domain-containing protein [Aspergillus pseudonomiae]KAE8396916.1 kinase-like domain-containing protein [Aspergillus pseudonomiae]